MSIRRSARRGRVTLSVVLSHRTRERASGEIPGISHPTMQVADPSGPSTTVSRWLQRWDGACLDGYPVWYADPGTERSRRLREGRKTVSSGIQTRITTVTGPYATRITPRRHCISPAGIEPATSGSKVQRPSPEDSLHSSSEPRLTAFGETPAETPGLNTAAACGDWHASGSRPLSATEATRSGSYRASGQNAASKFHHPSGLLRDRTGGSVQAAAHVPPP